MSELSFSCTVKNKEVTGAEMEAEGKKALRFLVGAVSGGVGKFRSFRLRQVACHQLNKENTEVGLRSVG